MGFRLALIIGIIAILYGGLTARFYELQIKKGDYYTAQAASATGASADTEASRGTIYFTDKNGSDIPVAVMGDGYYVYYVGSEAVAAKTDIKEASAKLSEILGVPEDKISAKLSKTDDPYEEIAKKIGEDDANKIKDMNIGGIHIGTRPIRKYPFGPTGEYALGFVSEGKGQYGIESFYDKELKGSADSDIRLSIDQNIQMEAERIIEDLVPEWGAESAQAIVMDPKTGAVLAIAGFPGYDPNKYSEYDMGLFTTKSIEALYEPGSVFKPITMAAGIDAGKITPDTSYVDTGSVTINGRKIMNWDKKAHGKLSMTQVIENSYNTGTVFAEKTMGHDIFLKYIHKFNLDEKTGIDMPGEVDGDIGSIIGGADVNYATASFGQGIALTPIRTLTSLNSIGNGGVMMKPFLLKGGKPVIDGTAISAETAKKVTDMMVGAVDKAKVAHISGYSVAGKTGTAFIPDFEKGGYTSKVINTYIGFAPAYDPRFSILIRLDDPKGDPLAGQTVVPAFRKLAEFILDYYNVAPDRKND